MVAQSSTLPVPLSQFLMLEFAGVFARVIGYYLAFSEEQQSHKRYVISDKLLHASDSCLIASPLRP